MGHVNPKDDLLVQSRVTGMCSLYLNVQVASIGPCKEFTGVVVQTLTEDMYYAGVLSGAGDIQDPWINLQRTTGLEHTLGV